jgi:hypothetical protein
MELFDEIIQNKQLEDTITERPKNRIRKDRVTQKTKTINNSSSGICSNNNLEGVFTANAGGPEDIEQK